MYTSYTHNCSELLFLTNEILYSYFDVSKFIILIVCKYNNYVNPIIDCNDNYKITEINK